MTCRRCKAPLEQGRCQDNGEVWCFECSEFPLDVEVREQKATGTFVTPPGPYRVILTPMHSWQGPDKPRGEA